MNKVIDFATIPEVISWAGRSVKFGDLYESARRYYNANRSPSDPYLNYGDDVISKLAYNNDFNTECPNLCDVIRILEDDDTLVNIPDYYFMGFMNFHPSEALSTGLVQAMENGDIDNWEFTPSSKIGFFSSMKSGDFGNALKYALHRVEIYHSKEIWNQISALLADVDALQNVNLTETVTPRVSRTTEYEENFKTSTTDKNKFKSTDTTVEAGYGFDNVNNAKPTPVSESVTTSQGSDTDNERNIISQGTATDNNSTRVESQTGQDTKTIVGSDLRGRSNDVMKILQEYIDTYRIEVKNLVLKAIRSELFNA